MGRAVGFLVSLLLLVVGLPSLSYGVPAFARQMGASCNACHTPHGFPTLNAFGRSFKAGGYTMVGAEQLISEGNFLSIPAVLNLAVVGKLRYISNSKGNPKTFWNLFDEYAVFVGGRVGPNAGFIAEGGTEAVPVSWRFVFPFDVGGGNKVGVFVGSTDALGASYVAGELLNTGAVPNIRFAEKDVSAILNLVGNHPATGLGAYFYSDKFYVSVAQFVPDYTGKGNDVEIKNFATYARAMVTTLVSGWDVGAGVQIYSGNAKATINYGAPVPEISTVSTNSGNVSVLVPVNSATVNAKAQITAVDLQAMGSVSGKPVAVTASFAQTGKNNQVGATTDHNGFSLEVEAGIIPDRFDVIAGVLSYRDNTAKKSYTDTLLGLKYHLFRNVQFQLNYRNYGKAKNNQLLLMLFTAF